MYFYYIFLWCKYISRSVGSEIMYFYKSCIDVDAKQTCLYKDRSRRDLFILKAIEMNINEVMESLNLDIKYITRSMRYELASAYSSQQLYDLGTRFVMGLDRNHHVPGKTIFTINGICSFYKETGEMTNDQRIYLTSNILNYWSEMSCQARAELSI